MDSRSFHPFPRLPLELRQQIWEDACFDWRGGRIGIHYIKMDRNRKLAPLDCNWDITGPRRKSAYLWHAGLWTACKELRDIVTKHWHSQGWPDAEYNPDYRNIGDRICLTTSSITAKGYWDFRYAILYKKGDYEPWHQIVDTRRDICCITADIWTPLVRRWKPICFDAIHNPLLWTKQKIETIALEFDPSWNFEIRKYCEYDRIKEFPPSLAFLMRILVDLAHRKLDSWGDLDGEVLLIDNDAQWYDHYPKRPDNWTYFDCDHEYIKEDGGKTVLSGSAVKRFLVNLDKVLTPRLTKIRYGGYAEDEMFNERQLPASSLIQLVVRRDNKIPEAAASFYSLLMLAPTRFHWD